MYLQLVCVILYLASAAASVRCTLLDFDINEDIGYYFEPSPSLFGHSPGCHDLHQDINLAKPHESCLNNLPHLYDDEDYLLEDYTWARPPHYYGEYESAHEVELDPRAGGPKPPNNPPGTKAKKKAPVFTPHRSHYTPAREGYRNTKGLPDRKTRYRTPTGDVVTGKDVRTAIFNTHLATGMGHHGSAKEFHNEPQYESDGSTTIPLPDMKGTGIEYPVIAGHKHGYRGGLTKGPIRSVITPEREGGHKFAGVIAHAVRKPSEHGYNYHYEVKGDSEHPTSKSKM